MKPRISAATYVGRIGGLAIALGVGAAVSLGQGVAWAEDSSSSGVSSSSSSSSSSNESRASSGVSAGPTAASSTSSTTRSSAAERTGTRSNSTPAAADDEAPSSRSRGLTRGTEQDGPAERALARSSAPAKTPATPPAAETTQTATSAAQTTPVGTTALASAARLAPPADGDSPQAPAPDAALLSLMASARREAAREMTSTAQSTSLAQSTTLAAAANTTAARPSALASTPLGWVTGVTNQGVLGGTEVPQTNDTSSFNIYGTDLGIMWDGGTIDGQPFIHLAFGDTFSGPRMTGDWRSNVLLISYDTDFYTGDQPGLELAQTGPAFQFIDASTTELGFLFPTEVTVIPTAGVQINGRQYVNYMSVRSWDTPGRWTTNYSAISQFYPGENGGDWRVVPSTIRSAGWFRSSTPYVAGNQNFQQFAYVLQPEDQVGENGVRYLYAFATPSGRAGSAYLSRVPEGSVTDLSRYEYWDGSGWVVGRPAAAVPIIGDSTRSAGPLGFIIDFANDPNVLGGYLGGLFGAKTGGNVSEMSVQYNEYLDQYVVLYGDGNNDIQMRTASQPQGPWSSPITLARSADYPGLYAPMIHPWSGTGLLTGRDGQPDVSTLYWNMSIWGDYNVVFMETDLSPLNVEQV
ncbi:DUF4185 domain-containing protein [Mycolicibacterium sp. S2-37]|uniref:DUF4185 domain-containing protein n=1 Tax=Mycolicibacterium sp. S2-37 TaxID=2810297 RepID=UPI001A953E80|nr:DUF4185 domain-containing protein [Mycolicibacterium sp. S2-37]MBO0676126.1 DUF4185 domain-containing protein [Mycolicibacterium sp. S2-37]